MALELHICVNRLNSIIRGWPWYVA